ncbi:class I SAM-dependent methyltransferase [Kribbella kalugense]|uniref:Methyltransferase family protein n=1 Tax=Kribbella kalugense TaxID=2512221 RepID=A0A4R8A063_9ACTN|nr:class I SAM-dependent methyltransferase [Kribbella kalugense]TDW23883.1 methyltransferase family protein [Kribbella kalugense]
MDSETLHAYDTGAAGYADDWETQPAGTDLQDLVRTYFTLGPTADVGCGSGRDTAWLTANGFQAVGLEPSAGLRAEAERRHPDVAFHDAALPELAGVASNSFTNVLCETVIMHLEPSTVGPAVRRLVDILKPGGVLYLTWRVSADDKRDDSGRLYAAVDVTTVKGALGSCDLLLDEEVTSASSGRTIHRVVARKHQQR